MLPAARSASGSSRHPQASNKHESSSSYVVASNLRGVWTNGTAVAVSPAMNKLAFASIDSSGLTAVTGGACAKTPAARIKAFGDSVDSGVGSPQNKAALACLHPAERREIAKWNPTGGNPFDPR